MSLYSLYQRLQKCCFKSAISLLNGTTDFYLQTSFVNCLPASPASFLSTHRYLFNNSQVSPEHTLLAPNLTSEAMQYNRSFWIRILTVSTLMPIVNLFLKNEHILFAVNMTLLDFMERNANHIIPTCCHLPVSCRSLVDRFGSLGTVSH